MLGGNLVSLLNGDVFVMMSRFPAKGDKENVWDLSLPCKDNFSPSSNWFRGIS